MDSLNALVKIEQDEGEEGSEEASTVAGGEECPSFSLRMLTELCAGGDVGEASNGIYSTTCPLPLSFIRYKDIIYHVREDRRLIYENPPIMAPEGGTIVAYDLSSVPAWRDMSVSEKRRCCRVDGYRWSHMKSSKALSNGLSRCYNFVFDPDSKKGSNLFVRNEYSLRDDPGGIVVFHYIGEHERARQVSQSSMCLSRRVAKVRITCNPPVSIAEAIPEVTESPQPSPSAVPELVPLPMEPPSRRWPNSLLLNLYEFYHTLTYPNGSHFLGDFVVTQLWVPCIVRPLVDELSAVIAVVGTQPIELMYSTTTSVEGLFVSSLAFRHPLFSSSANLQSPVVTLALLIHERNTAEQHIAFLHAVMKACGQVASGRYCIISEGRFPLENIWPNATLVHCWSDIVKDVRTALHSILPSQVDDIGATLHDLEQIMRSRTEIDFDSEWIGRKVSSPRYLNDALVRCMEMALGRVKKHASVWVLRESGIACPEVGVTASACEGLNKLLHDLTYTERPTPELTVCAFYYLGNYYHRELLKGYHQLGQYHLKAAYADRLQRRAPIKDVPFCPAVDSLVDYVKESGMLEINRGWDDGVRVELLKDPANSAKRPRLDFNE